MNVEKIWNQVARQYSKLIDTGKGTHHGYLVPILLDIVDRRGKQVQVLDVGCGEGYLVNQISKQEHEVVGVDISSELIGLAKEKYPKLKFLNVSASKISTEVRGRFDIIISNFAVHDMGEREIESFLLETTKVLKKDGLLVFSIPHPCFFNKS